MIKRLCCVAVLVVAGSAVWSDQLDGSFLQSTSSSIEIGDGTETRRPVAAPQGEPAQPATTEPALAEPEPPSATAVAHLAARGDSRIGWIIMAVTVALATLIMLAGMISLRRHRAPYARHGRA